MLSGPEVSNMLLDFERNFDFVEDDNEYTLPNHNVGRSTQRNFQKQVRLGK